MLQQIIGKTDACARHQEIRNNNRLPPHIILFFFPESLFLEQT
jgi:hypothetical protein